MLFAPDYCILHCWKVSVDPVYAANLGVGANNASFQMYCATALSPLRGCYSKLFISDICGFLQRLLFSFSAPISPPLLLLAPQLLPLAFASSSLFSQCSSSPLPLAPVAPPLLLCSSLLDFALPHLLYSAPATPPLLLFVPVAPPPLDSQLLPLTAATPPFLLAPVAPPLLF